MTRKQLKQFRLSIGWSQQRMADYLGLRHRSQVHHMESGRTKIEGPRLKLLEQLKARHQAGENLNP